MTLRVIKIHQVISYYLEFADNIIIIECGFEQKYVQNWAYYNSVEKILSYKFLFHVIMLGRGYKTGGRSRNELLRKIWNIFLWLRCQLISSEKSTTNVFYIFQLCKIYKIQVALRVEWKMLNIILKNKVLNQTISQLDTEQRSSWICGPHWSNRLWAMNEKTLLNSNQEYQHNVSVTVSSYRV